MKIDIRWQLLLALLCVGLIAALVSQDLEIEQGNCSIFVPSQGGRVVEGLVGRPTHLNPLLSYRNPIDEHFVSLLFRGLTRPLVDGQFEADLAESWTIEGNGLRVRFTLKPSEFWHDGQPITAADVAFTIDLIRNDNFAADPRLKEFWTQVEFEQLDTTTVEVRMTQPFAPIFEAASIGILPEHILGNIAPASLEAHDFNRIPIGSGAFLMASSTDWQQTGRLSLAPNPQFWSENVGIDLLEFRFYPDSQQLLDAYSNGEIMAFAQIQPEIADEAAILDGMRLFSYGRNVVAQLTFNLGEESSEIARLSDGRRALSLSLDRPKILDTVTNGQGIIAEAPFLPGSWAVDGSHIDVLSKDTEESARILDSLGWLQIEGSTVRAKDGQTLSLRLAYVDEPFHAELARALRDQWSEIGMEIEAIPMPIEAFESVNDMPGFDMYLASVRLPADPDLYDFWSQQAILTGHNIGSWNNRWASEALEGGRQVYNTDERLPFYRAFASFFKEDLPALFLFQYVRTYGISDAIRNVDIGPQHDTLDRYKSFPDWSILLREVPVRCEKAENGESTSG